MIVVEVTPAIAERMLATIDESEFRPASLVWVARFARMMRQERWVLRAIDPIRVNIFGELRHGRIRLMAVIESGCTVPMYVSLVSDI